MIMSANGLFVNGTNFHLSYMSLVERILSEGGKKSPRGQGISYFQNCLFKVEYPKTVFSVPSRDYKFDYLNKELDLYFKGDLSAEAFGKASKFWLQLANPDGNINSNYGYHVFYREIETKFGNIKNQWTYAKQQLLNDKDTRQALIFISTPSVQFDGNKDFICTLNYVFNIDEENKLHLTVNRRSQDLFFGLPYDYAFEFLLLYKMYNELKDLYPELEIGSYTMFCNNIHIYDRNKETFEKMLNDYKNNDIVIDNIIDKVDQNIIKNYVLNKNFGN
jgi:thymidylate synthase